MLEGKEIEKSYDEGAGQLSVDVTDKGEVKFENTYNKDLGFAKVKTSASVEVSIFSLAEQTAKKTKTTWDDSAIAALKKLLGVQEVG